MDTLLLVLPALAGMIATMQRRTPSAWRRRAGFALATDVAE